MNRLSVALILSGAAMIAQPGAAQNVVEARVDRLEREMRAVQRKVFPGGAGQMIEPQITAPQSPLSAPGVPATSAVADLTARISSLESQLSSLTGQIEQNQFKLRQLEQAFEAYKRSTDAKLAAPSAAVPGEGAGVAASGDTRAAPPPRINAPAAADPARAEQVAAVPRPSTGDAGEDAYTYGYRLWSAKLYPEAAAALKTAVADHPNHRRASFAQNLLGRAYLDDGKPSLASIAFYDNYKKMPDGERAPDSLYYLGQALIQLKKPADACKVYDELTDVYAGKISASMAADSARARTTAKCK
ncbi:tol-pal system YbgF family protein [Sphingomonas sp. IW22]|uniref:tol-pal system YbgF family protein n=1 Tax=Sphingomonas sp. IW22 TaxID=3242489 RepID=UPI003521501B